MTVTFNDKDYELRLTAKSCVDLEKKLGTNPVNTLVHFAEKNEIPTFASMFTIVQAALPKTEKAEELYDNMRAEGKGFEALMELVVDIFKDAGLIPEDEEEEGKN